MLCYCKNTGHDPSCPLSPTRPSCDERVKALVEEVERLKARLDEANDVRQRYSAALSDIRNVYDQGGRSTEYAYQIAQRTLMISPF